MSSRVTRKILARFLCLLFATASMTAAAQMESETGETEAKTPRDAAPIDLSGYWVSMIVEDWRWRMVTPPKGNYASMRRVLNEEGNRVADMWDPEKDASTCKHFGAAGMIRNPMRVRFSWVDDHTLKMETDHGMQTRFFRFEESPHESSDQPTLQGNSAARWHMSGLEVVTTDLSPGYLRKNGVPYSADTLLTEYFDIYQAFGEQWLTVKTIVNDPVYLSDEFLTSTDFKKLPDDNAWHPVACGSG